MTLVELLVAGVVAAPLDPVEAAPWLGGEHRDREALVAVHPVGAELDLDRRCRQGGGRRRAGARRRRRAAGWRDRRPVADPQLPLDPVGARAGGVAQASADGVPPGPRGDDGPDVRALELLVAV